jgi:hypothetical protein
MSREIKFRAWDKKTGKRKYPVMAITNNFLNSKVYIIEQFTGKLTANGQEIYDGDIVAFKFRGKDGSVFSYKGKIIFDQYMWLAETEGGDVFSLNRIHGVQVIGNIFENPNLLK